jgi:hypothetical protein
MELDTHRPLESIRDESQAPLISRLLETQKHIRLQAKSQDLLQKLECLFRIDLSEPPHKRRRSDDGTLGAQKSKLLGRKTINPLRYKEDFVAVSYYWKTLSTSHEETAVGGYQVQSRTTRIPIPSQVRDVVLERVTKYVEYCESKGPLFWIDQESIDQKNDAIKAIAMQSMDRVYSLSKFPVGLLSTLVESDEDLTLLVHLLRGLFINNEEEAILTAYAARALKTLNFLGRLTSDRWWDRAWIFQEDYLAGIKMKLLIPHHSSLEARKRDEHKLLGKIPGELCVSCADFRKQVTRFCLSYQKFRPQHENRCKDILRRAAKYTITLRELDGDGYYGVHKSMSSSIFADIGRRGITNQSDVLDIAANCCSYSVRLDVEALKKAKCSLSLSILALYLLNGEVVCNDQMNDRAALSGNIYDLLLRKSLNNFNLSNGLNELTFLKRCRFPDVRLSREGIETTGQLWRLGKVIDTSKFLPKLPPGGPNGQGLNSYQRKRLRQLADVLSSGAYGSSYGTLTKDIYVYLQEDDVGEDDQSSKLGSGGDDEDESEDSLGKESDDDQESDTNEKYETEEDDHNEKHERLAKNYKDVMVEALVQAIKDGTALRLACLGDVTGGKPIKNAHSSYCAIFVTGSSDEAYKKEPSYVFTASKYSDRIEKFVSLEVELAGSMSGVPLLITKKWVNGLCFLDKYAPKKVLFPWPPSWD